MRLADMFNYCVIAIVKEGTCCLSPRARSCSRSAAPELQRLYRDCKEAFQFRLSTFEVASAESREEAAFYVAVADFFLKRRQAELVKAGKAMLRKVEALFGSRRSFNQETTFSGRLTLRNARRAHEAGYRVLVYYIGVENAELAIERVRHRAELGGHDIDAESVRRRYRSSLANFSRVLDLCEQAAVFDNTDDFTCLAIWLHGSLVWWGGPGKGDWLGSAMTDDAIWIRG